MSLRHALPAAVALLLAGCASTVTTQVTSFHQLSNGLEGQRFIITPSDEQRGSLEFETYAALVRQALVGEGLVDAGTAAGNGVQDRAADLGVAISYAVSGGSTASGSHTGGFAGFGVGSGGFSMGSVGIGIGFPIGSAGPSDSTIYHRSLRVEIDRLAGAAASPPSGAGKAGGARVFEARATSEGQSASVAPVMRAMVHAIFEEFPGPSGKTRVVRVPLDETM